MKRINETGDRWELAADGRTGTREDGPVAEFANGLKIWGDRDRYFREHGPAIETGNYRVYFDMDGNKLGSETAGGSSIR